jgi:alkanesulfonate monooxygenase SsuD/methylene tetrahydromethanopterin reductase-like flavin-dependent oxidoreductase (luciferase family)
MAKMAGAVSDGLMINLANPDMIREIVGNFFEGARQAGRDTSKLQVVSKVRVSLHEDAAQARNALKKVLTFYSLQRGYSDMLCQMGWATLVDKVQETHRTDGFAAARRLIPDEMVDDVPMYADSNLDRLPAKLAGYEEAGSTRCVVAYVPADDDNQWSEIEHYLINASFVHQGSFV